MSRMSRMSRMRRMVKHKQLSELMVEQQRFFHKQLDKVVDKVVGQRLVCQQLLDDLLLLDKVEQPL